MLQVTIWMNMPSFHQDGLFHALMSQDQVELRVVFARETTSDRRKLGWTATPRNYSHRFLQDRFKLWEAVRIAWSERRRLHIVNGIWAEPSFAAAVLLLALAGSKFAVYAEAPDYRQNQTGMRAFLRRSFGGWVARRTVGILAVSRFAERFYIHLGFAREHVYPFGYFEADHEPTPRAPRAPSGERTEVIFVGQLIPRKGVDLLMDAISPLFAEYPTLVMSLVGDGGEIKALQARARSLGIEDLVSFEGATRSDEIRPRVASADVLVLPSRWDGWGMVVNEALSVRVPVIVSDRCGAADLVQHGVNGYVFRSEDVEDLRRCLRSFLENPDACKAMRSAAAATGQAVSAEQAAPYMVECLKHMIGENAAAKPAPPWAQLSAPQSASH